MTAPKAVGLFSNKNQERNTNNLLTKSWRSSREVYPYAGESEEGTDWHHEHFGIYFGWAIDSCCYADYEEGYRDRPCMGETNNGISRSVGEVKE